MKFNQRFHTHTHSTCVYLLKQMIYLYVSGWPWANYQCADTESDTSRTTHKHTKKNTCKCVYFYANTVRALNEVQNHFKWDEKDKRKTKKILCRG